MVIKYLDRLKPPKTYAERRRSENRRTFRLAEGNLIYTRDFFRAKNSRRHYRRGGYDFLTTESVVKYLKAHFLGSAASFFPNELMNSFIKSLKLNSLT